MITLRQFFMRLTALTLLLSLIIYALQKTSVVQVSGMWGGLLFYYILTLLIFALAIRALKMNVKQSMSIIFASLAFRLFASLAYIVIYLITTGIQNLSFVIGFLILYLFFTVFEIYHLVVNLRPDSKKERITNE